MKYPSVYAAGKSGRILVVGGPPAPLRRIQYLSHCSGEKSRKRKNAWKTAKASGDRLPPQTYDEAVGRVDTRCATLANCRGRRELVTTANRSRVQPIASFRSQVFNPTRSVANSQPTSD